MSRIILIYPNDPTTRFLEPISHLLKDVLGNNLILLEPSPNGQPSNGEIVNKVNEIENAETVIFMGHGTKSSLFGGTDDERQYELLNFRSANRILHKKNFVCLSCWSAEFIYGLDGLNSSIGFGNLPTTWKDITDARSVSKNAYKDYTEKSIEIYQRELVSAFASGWKYGLSHSFSLKNIYSYIKLHVNKAISRLVASDLEHQLAARQLYIFKSQMNFQGLAWTGES